MKLTVPIKLITSDLQHQALYETLIKVNEACNFISEASMKAEVFRQFDIHKELYYTVKDRYNLTSQMIIRSIAKVAYSYKLNKKVAPKYKLTGAIAYDNRILMVKPDKQFVSIRTLLGRININYTTGEHQQNLLKHQKGECDLVYKNNKFYLYCTCDVPEEILIVTNKVIGIDLGIVNIATTSLNKNYSGSHLNSLRKRHKKLRAKLQSKGTRSAKKLLKKRSKKEQHFAAHVNHVISKEIVSEAKRTKSAISLEKLKGISKRTRVRKSQRDTLSSWSFYQLQQFIDYKAKLNGIPVFYVNPKNTSIECPKCGLTTKKNRKTRNTFECELCGLAGPADYIAACNIASRASVNKPNVNEQLTV